MQRDATRGAVAHRWRGAVMGSAMSAMLVGLGCGVADPTTATRAPPELVLPGPPLHRAVRGREADAARRLLDAGAEIDATDTLERTALHWAAIVDDAGLVRLLAGRGARLDARAHHDLTPLHWAALRGSTNAARALLRAGAAVEARDLYGRTPLHEAASGDVVRVLVRHGASWEARDGRGDTPVHTAAGEDAARALLDAGADPFVRGASAWRPPQLAAAASAVLRMTAGPDPVRVRGATGVLTATVRSLALEPFTLLRLEVASPAARAAAAPVIAALQPGQLVVARVPLARHAAAAPGEHPLTVRVLEAAGRELVSVTLHVDTTREETPEDRGELRVARVSLRRSTPWIEAVGLGAPLALLAIGFAYWRWRVKRGRGRGGGAR